MQIKQGISVLTGILGVLLGLGGLFVYLIWGEPVWLYTTLLILAVVHLSVFLVTHFEMLKDFSSRRSTKFGANSVLMVVIFVAILGIVNFILARHDVRFDLSGTGAFSLSPQTVNILNNLKRDVKITGFFGEASNVKAQAKDLFENYRHQSEKVKYEFIDPDKKPTVAKQYGITDYDTAVLESGGQSATVKAMTEEALTSALIRISRDGKKVFYFIEGHGERSIDDADRQGYSVLKETLEKQGFAVKKLLLLSEKKIPDDADVVILGGPQRSLTAEERGALDAYLEREGQLFVLLDPLVKTDLEGFLSKWGVRVENDLILDPTSGLGGAVPVVNPGTYLPHEMTRAFNLATFYPLSRSVAVDPANEGTFRFEPFLQTGPNSWLTKQVEGDVTIDPQRDKKGPITLGAVVSRQETPSPAEANPADRKKKMRLVFIGDADFATNSVVRSAGNGDLFQNVVSWLADEGDLVSIRPQEASTATLLLTAQQMKMTLYTSVLILPAAILTVGLSIWRRRRRL
jgi:ABC-type uncharacterized transport system involved in gliding motility auxiliary subunit